MAPRHWKFIPFKNGPDYLDGAIMDGAVQFTASSVEPVCYCNEGAGRQIEKIIAENQQLKQRVKRLRAKLEAANANV